MINDLDARDRPPECIKTVYKRYQKLTFDAIESDPVILDFRRGLSDEQRCGVRRVDSVPQSSIDAACLHLGLAEAPKDMQPSMHMSMYEIDVVPGEYSNAQN